MRSGRRIGIDVGTVRIGIATCDPSGLIATPVETVKRGEGDIDRIATLITELEAIEVVVGLPRSMSGSEGKSAAYAAEFAATLARAIAPVQVRLLDERLSTVAAGQQLRASGVPGRRARSVVDQAAAVVILQAALDAERLRGAPPGRLVQADA